MPKLQAEQSSAKLYPKPEHIMKELSKVYSHLSIAHKQHSDSQEIARSDPLRVKNYAELLEHTATLSYRNRGLYPLYRGQDRDHQTKPSGGQAPQSKILSSFYRPPGGKRALSQPLRLKRIAALDSARLEFLELIRKQRREQGWELSVSALEFHHELVWAILQHYEIVPTPLLDLTQSLHVACSFAGGRDGEAVLYMFGVETINSTIAYFYNEGLEVIRLSGVMPQMAKRPFYQEAFLLGDFPLTRCLKDKSLNFAVRLLAKFSVNPGDPDFWPKGMSSLPEALLFPPKDAMRDLLEPLKKNYAHLWNGQEE
jgi:hypothetical protein